MTIEKKPTLVEDPDAPPNEEERVASERLRDALADPTVPSADADFARALSLAHEPREIDAKEHAAIVERAIAVAARPRGRVIRVAFGAAAFLAVAAAALLVLGRVDMMKSAEAPSVAVRLVPARSTQSLFDAPFAEPLSRGAASARIDRIAVAREADLRENRFAMWGVR